MEPNASSSIAIDEMVGGVLDVTERLREAEANLHQLQFQQLQDRQKFDRIEQQLESVYESFTNPEQRIFNSLPVLK
jgi:septation ring formation regulator EzrA